MALVAYDKVLVNEAFKMYPLYMTDLRSLPRAYRSIWRVLHCDGFEQRTIQWFRYTPLGV